MRAPQLSGRGWLSTGGVDLSPELLRYGEGRGTELTRLVLDEHVGDGLLHVAAMAASCDDDAAVEFPACHIHQQDWGVPVRLVPGADSRLTLTLHG